MEPASTHKHFAMSLYPADSFSWFVCLQRGDFFSMLKIQFFKISRNKDTYGFELKFFAQWFM